MPRSRLLFLALAAASLMTGMWAGLVRIGWQIPPLQPGAHGPLMISGFLGVVIGLERAVAFKRRWAYAVPLLAGMGGVALIVGLPREVAGILLVASSTILIGAFCLAYYQHYGNKIEPSALTLILGAVLWLAGNGLWLGGQPLSRVTPWWIGFLVITIAGERLELSRVLLLGRAASTTFIVSVGIFVGGLIISLWQFNSGLQIGGVGLAGLGVWLLVFDVARRTIRQTGLTRFIAACLLPGYVWLAVGGGLWIFFSTYFSGGPYYDAMAHTILLGFVFSMIFGHEPIILPAVLGGPMAYRPTFYAHLVLLHASVIVRVLGDLLAQPTLRMWGGLLNVAAILVFIGNTLAAVRRQTTS